MEDDTLLVDRFRRGDVSAFDVLFRRHKDGIYSLIRRTAGQVDVDDLVQETFIRIYRSLPRFRGESSFRTWAYRITLRTCADRLRKQGREPKTCGDEAIDHQRGQAAGVHEAAVERSAQEALAAALRELSGHDRAVVEMHYVHGMSYSEIAVALDGPVGTVKARIHHAIARLRKQMVPWIEEVAR